MSALKVNKSLKASVAIILTIGFLNLPTQAKAVSSNPPPCNSGQCEILFSYTGDYYAWIVPATGDYTFQAWGASGGGGIRATSGGGSNAYGRGGAGGYASGTRTLTAGTVLYIYVGQQGSLTTSASFGGGGGGNVSATGTYLGGFSGGGATHVSTSLGALSTLNSSQSSVLIVAGGGGGGGGGSASSWEIYAADGGVGGGSTGASGQTNGSGTGGGGGTQLASGSSTGTPVTSSAFGLGATSTSSKSSHISGGGGGGGWYGGGAGNDFGGGGGGGSGYVDPLTSSSLIAGNATMPDPVSGTTTGRTGNGVLKISYLISLDSSTTFTIAGNQRVLNYNTGVILTATISTPGRVTFFADGKRIANCISKLGTTSVTCNFLPKKNGAIYLSATLRPTDSGYRVSSSDPLAVTAIKRSGTR